MRTVYLATGMILFVIAVIIGCSKKDLKTTPTAYPYVRETFGTNIDLNNLSNYANQSKPNYILKDNSAGAAISNAKATLGRVLFYDKNLSIDNSVSCASCHKQEFAFGDADQVSKGVQGGVTVRHSMRLVNTRFANERKFFWNERAATLEIQTTRPIQDHAEMGFSGESGRPGLQDLFTKLQNINYYKELFQFVYGDQTITETRLQECLSQFIRSIQSFDSKYDAGRVLVGNENQPFPNFSAQENNGKRLFLTPPAFNGSGVRINGGLGCNGCHQAPEFDIDPNTRNNGITATINNSVLDLDNTRAPSLRDLTKPNGTLNTPLMHTGSFNTLRSVILHYNNINHPVQNTNIDPRLIPNGTGQQLQVTEQEIADISAFLITLSGNSIYTDKKWGNPFQ